MRPRQIRPAAVLAAGLLAASAAHAQLFKCVSGGKVVYQDSPCEDTAKQSTVRAPAPGPEPAAAPKSGAPATPASAPAASPSGNAVEIVAGFTICSERVPNFARKYTDAYEGWKMRNGAAMTRLSNEPDASRLDERMRAERARPESESIAERCADIATSIQPPRNAGAPIVTPK